MMKKFFAIVLGFALVLGLAGVASADVSATGTVEITGKYASSTDWTFAGLSKAEGKLKISNEWGTAASGDVTFKFSIDPVSISVDAGVDDTWGNTDDVKAAIPVLASKVDTANFNYKFSDAFTLSAGYAADKFKVYSKNALYDDIKTADTTQIKGVLTFDGGSATVYANGKIDAANMALYGALSYNVLDELTLSGYLGYEPAGMWVVAEGKYALGSEITFFGAVKYVESTELMTVAGKGSYKIADQVEANVKVQYQLDPEVIDYTIDGKYFLVKGVFDVYGAYDDDDKIKVGAEYIFGKDTKLSAEYITKAGSEGLTVKLAMAL